MDQFNRFSSKTVFWLLRAEYGFGLVVCATLFLMHVGHVRWIPAIILFTYIDLIGYIPGMIAYHLSGHENISRIYYVLYNLMHSLVSQGIVIGLWIYIAGFEWALLAVPIHLCGDRAIFGNFVKGFRLPFEPEPIPQFVEFEQDLDRTAGPGYQLAYRT